jgi:hypothetical protein
MFDLVILSPWFLPTLFFIVALVYSSVGLGGGSSYTALMSLVGMSTLAIPMVSLTLNLIVTTVGSFNFIRSGHARIRLIAPFLVSSMPAAYLGGTLQVSTTVFHWVLLVSLLFVAARIYLWQETRLQLDLGPGAKITLSLVVGAMLGLIAGIVGIGGGVYLVPLVIILGLGEPRQAAACGAIFIWLNSAAGLVARLQYNSIDFSQYIPLIVAVLLGGLAGSFMGASRFSARTIEKVLGAVILVAIGFMLRKILA